MFKNYLLFFLILTVFQCSENENPVNPTEALKAPVLAMSFIPRRKYISQVSPDTIFIKRYYKQYSCSEITQFGIEAFNDTLKPSIRLSRPKNLNDCSIDVEGSDSLWEFSFKDWKGLPRIIYLKNSGDSITDSVILISEEHRDTGLLIEVRDSILKADQTAVSADFLPDSLDLICGDSISYGFYCLDSLRDTLYLWLKTVGGREAKECPQDSVYTCVVEKDFIHEIKRDSVQGCLSTMPF